MKKATTPKMSVGADIPSDFYKTIIYNHGKKRYIHQKIKSEQGPKWSLIILGLLIGRKGA
ncbi:MAG: hypothetical protein ACLFQM_04545 [Fidelibacterota bacterium]